MPGKTPPDASTLQGFIARLQDLSARIVAIQAWRQQCSAIIAPGVITQWAGPAVPLGALACNGQSFSAAAYPALYAALGTTTVPTISGSPMFVIWTGSKSSIPA